MYAILVYKLELIIWFQNIAHVYPILLSKKENCCKHLYDAVPIRSFPI